MTKEEVRCVSIARLELDENAVVYDVGAGTGSVSVEAALSGCRRVYAVEKNPEARYRNEHITLKEIIDSNCRTDDRLPV